MSSVQKVFSGLPVAKSFPSLGFGVENSVPKIYPTDTKFVTKDILVKPKTNKLTFLKKLFNRLQHK